MSTCCWGIHRWESWVCWRQSRHHVADFEASPLFSTWRDGSRTTLGCEPREGRVLLRDVLAQTRQDSAFSRTLRDFKNILHRIQCFNECMTSSAFDLWRRNYLVREPRSAPAWKTFDFVVTSASDACASLPRRHFGFPCFRYLTCFLCRCGEDWLQKKIAVVIKKEKHGRFEMLVAATRINRRSLQILQDLTVFCT